jgi:F-type H+-transporting ATPase subunit epsilon
VSELYKSKTGAISNGMGTFALRIVSPKQEIFKNEARMVVVRGIKGELGILAKHTPLLSLLKPGKVRLLDKEDRWQELEIGGGFLEVAEEEVTLLAAY